MIATLGGGTVTRLFTGAEPPEPAHADFSPDGRQIAFQAGHEGSWDIWIANSDGSGARDLVDCTSPCTILNDPAWSPLGNEIAFSKLSEIGDALPSDLQIVDLRTGTVRTVLSEPSGLAIEQPRWSRDARSIVLSLQDHRSPDGSLVEHPVTSTVGIVDLDEATPSYRALTDPRLNASYPDWNPDDDRIVFQGGQRIWWDEIATSRSQIWTIQSDGSQLRQISVFGPDDPVYWMPAWSSAGNRILATRTDRATRDNAIVYIPLDGSTPRETIVAGAHGRESRARGG
jgi:Tol biopolymer transport system component